MAERQFRFDAAFGDPEIHSDADQVKLKATEIPISTGMDVFFKTSAGLITTGRSLEEYKAIFPTIQVPYGQQLIEFGGGLSELTALVAKMHHDRMPEKKPVIVDVADYELMQDMLRFALQNIKLHSVMRERRDKIEALLERCDIILNPDMVRLSQNTLQKTLTTHPDLAHSADIGIDIFGPLQYPETEAPHLGSYFYDIDKIKQAVQQMLDLEKQFMKEGGVLLQNKK